jgi:magnesium-transporting ATPase (P-type)
MFEWYNSTWMEIVKRLNSNIYSGLDEEQVNSSRDKYGKNKIWIPETKGIFLLSTKYLKQLWIILLLIIFGFFLYLKVFYLAFLSLIIVALNLVCSALDEYNIEKNLKELQKLNMGYARVTRDGRILKIPIEKLVVGDIVIVGKGESIPADLRVIESDELQVNETSVTGEKFISEKYETKIEDKELLLSDMKNILFKSSIVVSGSGTGIVIFVGKNTQIGNITRLFLTENNEYNLLNRKIHKIINIYSLFIIIALALDIGIGISMGENINSLIKYSSTFILGTIPQGIIISITIISEVLFRKMRKKAIVFKDISTVEKLSSVSLICTDKIGGLSENKMQIGKIFTNNSLNILENIGSKGIEENGEENLYRLMNIALLCNDTKINSGTMLNQKDDIMEISLVKFGFDNALDKRKLEREHERVFNIPFDTERRIMTTVNRIDKNYRAHVKGAVDSLLTRCTHIMKNGIETEITEEDIQSIKVADIKMSSECLSVIGTAYRNFNYEPSINSNIESNLVFVGLIGFENKLKKEAIESIKKCNNLNIKPIIITEDNKITAFAIGRKLGIVSKFREILSGVEIDNMSEEEFQRIIQKISIFSRIRFKNKLNIIKNLKEHGHITLMTGTKITDLPALKISNIGITSSNSKLVKKMSDIFTEDINFMKLLNMVEDSRKIVNVLRKVIIYIISCSVSMLIFIMLTHMGGYDITSISSETIWFNNVIMIMSSLTLIVQYEDESTYFPGFVIDKASLKERFPFIIFNGALMGIGAFVILILNYGGGKDIAQVSAFSVLNISAVLFNYSFSNTIFFKSHLSNILMVINLLLQVGIIALSDTVKLTHNIIYLKNILIFIGIWFVKSLFNKFYSMTTYF